MKNLWKILFSIGAFLGVVSFSVSNAAEISNFNVIPPTGGSTTLSISWDPLSNAIMSEFDGYAIQWGSSDNKVRNVDLAQLFFNSSTTSTSLRAADFERGEYHYFRMYAYKVDGRLTTLAHGSKVLKWKWLSNGTVEKEFIESKDPVISAGSSGDDRTFSNIQVDPRDTYVGISWGAIDLFSGEGYLIEISKTESFAEKIAEYYIPNGNLQIRVDKFFPETDYWVRGSLHSSTKEKIGTSITKAFRTIVTMSDSKKALIKRLKDRGLGAWVDKSPTDYSLENENNNSSSSTTTTTTTPKSTTPPSTSTKRTSNSTKRTFFDFDPKLVTESELNAALTELALMQNKIKNQIRKLRLQNQ